MSKAKATSKEKEKGVELKDVEEIERPRPTSTRSLLTLKPLPKIDPKDKGKKKIEEENETESEDDDIPQAVKKFKQLESDEELARKVQEEWEAEEEKNKIAEEEAANEALINNIDDVKARIEADRILAEKLQEQEREQFTIEERAKFLHDTIAAQRKFLAQQRSQAIRNKPPTKNQLRNQMMTYIKHVGNYKHADLKSKKFEDIQALYEKIKRFNEDFISTRSAQDERFIKRMNEKGAGLSKSEVIKEETKGEVKIEDKEEESTRKRKLGTRKKMKSRKRRYIQNTSEDNNEKEDDELKLYLSIVQDEEKEVDYEILDRKYPIIDWKTVCLGTKPQFDESKEEEINLNVVTRSNGQQRYFSILTTVLSIFDREDLNVVFQLVMDKYHDEMPEGFERVLWGDLKVLFNPDEQDEFWSSQHEWKVISWKLHSSSGVHTLMTNEGVVIHMLTEKKYPLKKEIVVQMLNLKLESEEESTMALELIRFIKKGNQLTLLLGEELASPNSNDEELSIPEQTATGKGTSNPLMAGRTLPCLFKYVLTVKDPEPCSIREQKPVKEKLTCAPVIVSPNWNLQFELICNASDFAFGAVLGQKDGKNFHPIYVASKTLNPAQQKYTVTEKELMAVVFAFDKFRSYLILSKTIVHTDHSALKHLLKKRRKTMSYWAEAQALPTNDARVVITFLKKLLCRFKIPKALISDRGNHFCNKIMEKTMKRYGVNHRFSTSYHPQTSGQVENTNRALKRILEKTVKDNPAIWSRKLDDAL
ncbi:reverse transcriptase domain-containing protein [Tanacetum coccineum]